MDGTAGQTVTVHLTGNSISRVAVKLLKPDGAVLAQTIGFSGSFNLGPPMLPTTGTYIVRLDPSGNSTGSITVRHESIAVMGIVTRVVTMLRITRTPTMTRALLRLLLSAFIPFLPATVSAQPQDVVVYFHTDAVGSVRMVTDAAGQEIQRYDYLPFGEPWPGVPMVPETRQFTGQERDTETALDQFGSRYYSSNMGRFTSPDDPHAAADLLDPRTLNLYVYALNNPLRYVDPSGFAPCPPPTDTSACVEVTLPPVGTTAPDPNVLQWLLERFGQGVEVVSNVQIPTLGPPDPNCVAGFIGGTIRKLLSDKRFNK